MKVDILQPDVQLQAVANHTGTCRACGSPSDYMLYWRGHRGKDKHGRQRRFGLICIAHYQQLMTFRANRRKPRTLSYLA